MIQVPSRPRVSKWTKKSTESCLQSQRNSIKFMIISGGAMGSLLRLGMMINQQFFWEKFVFAVLTKVYKFELKPYLKKFLAMYNWIHFSLPFKKCFILIIIISYTIVLSSSHYIKKVVRPVQKVTGYTNQSQQFYIPFSKCFKAVPQLEANSQYMNFKPSSLELIKQIDFSIASNHNISLLQALRSSLTLKHKAMTILQDNLIMIYSVPNKILIIKEQEHSFQVIDEYRIEEMHNLSTPFRLYKFSKNRSIMIIQNHRYFYILDDKGYQSYALPVDITFSHLQNLEGDDILIAQFNKGLGHYRLNHQTRSIDMIKRYTKDDLKLDVTYIVDVNTNYINEGEVYMLDAKAGMIKMKYDKGSKVLSNPELIVKQSSCQAFDSVESDYFVLLCQIQGYSSIIQIYKKQVNNKITYERLEPIYHSTFFTDIQVSNKFYMIFSNKLINVFWNTKKNQLPETLDTQSQISIPGLETFKLKKIYRNNQTQIYLYAVESGKLVRYLMEQSPPKLSFKSSQSIYKNITVYMYGSCEQIGQNNMVFLKPTEPLKSDTILTCEIKQELTLNFQDQTYGKDQDFSISASIIVLLILIFLVVIWICLKKYKGLEKQARKVLEVYKNKKGNQHRPI